MRQKRVEDLFFVSPEGCSLTALSKFEWPFYPVPHHGLALLLALHEDTLQMAHALQDPASPKFDPAFGEGHSYKTRPVCPSTLAL